VIAAPRFFLYLALAVNAGPVDAMGREAQELASIQKKIAPDQCELQRLSAEDMAAKRAGDQGKRQELAGRMVEVVRRIQGQQPRIQELTQHVPPGSPDYLAVQQQVAELRARCKP
jgi:hypothetical protein